MADILQSTSSWLSSIFSSNYPLVSVTSTVDGRAYKVRDLPDKQEAANLMATAVNLEVPSRVDVETGPSWGSAA